MSSVKILVCVVFAACVAGGFVAPGEGFRQDVHPVLQLKQTLDVSQRRAQLEVEGSEPFHLVASFE